MSKNKTILIPLLITCLTGNHSFSQQLKKEIKPDQYRAVKWTMLDGLSSDGTNVMIKDAKGFLWSGSPGAELCRFDGARFKTYIPDPNKRGAINSIGITALVEDSLNNIWIGTEKGLSRYDMKADTFSNFTTTIVSDISSRPVVPFWSTRSHVYCFESGSGFARYDVRSLKRDSLLLTPGKTIYNTPQPGYIIFDSASNSLWMLETYSQNPDRGGLLRISLDDGQRKKYPWPCLRTNITHRHSAEAIQFDPKRNSIWINSGDGLLEFTLADNQFHQIDAFNEYIKLKDYERWVGIDIVGDGKIWLATHRGILIYDPKTNQVQQAFSDVSLQKSVGDANMHVYCDRDGIVWISNWMGYGLYELLPFNSSVKRYAAKFGMQDSLSNGFVLSIIPSAKGKLWLGTIDGMNIFDPLTEKFEVLREKDLPGLRGTAIFPLHVDTLRQKAWLCAGLLIAAKIYKLDVYEMDIKSRKCKRIIFRDGTKQFDSLSFDPALVKPYKNGILVGTDVYGVFEIKEGSLFADLVVPMYTMYAKEKLQFSRMELEEERSLFLKPYNVLPNFNFEIKNGKWEKTSHPLDSVHWSFMIYNEKDKTHWTSFKNKLVHYDNNFREIKTYTREDGYTDLAYRMILDNADNLWFVNNLQQVGRLNIPTGIITMLSETDGYHKKDFDWGTPLTKDANGNIYFGTGYSKGGEGLDCILLEKLATANPSSVYFRSLVINQKPFPLSTGVNNLEELSLRYNQNTISIETGIIDFYTKEKSNLRYKLVKEGKDEDWQYGPAYNTIRYDGLVPGNYKLVMQASNANKEFNGPEKILMISIDLPFWQTWWFRVFALILLVDVIYNIVRWQLRKKFKLQMERSEKETQMAEMRQRTAELLQQKTELEMQALRAQMNPHFIFNSLNSINRFILQNNRTQASEYLTKFSKLVRLILQNSQASLITLESELQALELYLDLEALRFDHRFGYKISVPKDLDIEALKVPPLIIQPYTENAIWHGLMHKEDKGQLDIEVSEEGDHLYFKIADNGVGRKQAAAMASKSATKHKSMGLRITENRIAMLQKVNGESPVKIIDLENADGSAAGTEVIIKMPVIFGD